MGKDGFRIAIQFEGLSRLYCVHAAYMYAFGNASFVIVLNLPYAVHAEGLQCLLKHQFNY